MLDLEARPLVESRLLRARAFREEYLDLLGREDAAARADGVILAEEMRRESLQWSKLRQKPDGWLIEDGAFKQAKAALVGRLRKARVEAIFAALAVDWQSRETWWRHDLWDRAVDEVARDRREELERAERARIRRDLRRAKVPDEMADRYIHGLKTEDLRLRIDFPPKSDYLRGHPDPERLTTGFILRFHEYDRGFMFPAYGMSFDDLAGLDGSRIETLLPALYGSDDERLRTVARQAINLIPGTRFVETVMNRLMDDPTAWRTLICPSSEEETKARLEAMCDMAEKRFSSYGVCIFWDRLRASECFEGTVIEGAIGRLHPAHEELRSALRSYLSAAMSKFDPEPLPWFTPDEYRAWFRAHPRPESR